MDEQTCYEILSKCRDGVVCTNGDDGFPYGTPVNYILMDGKIYFHGRQSGTKCDNISRDPRVCFTVYSHENFEITGPATCNVTTNYTSVIVKGRCVPVTDQEEKERILFALVERLVPVKAVAPVDPHRAASTAVFSVTIDAVSGKRRRASPEHATV
ncbi:MAG: pyridoxamine 5'-phosphate oxidase family protein [Candidatus Methanomethylophilaceae archaeon]|nr:pyridoxamine 5'-phosphate oxidase family protein [Candidatus Methanomethylophilaceae archaeon]